MIAPFGNETNAIRTGADASAENAPRGAIASSSGSPIAQPRPRSAVRRLSRTLMAFLLLLSSAGPARSWRSPLPRPKSDNLPTQLAPLSHRPHHGLARQVRAPGRT